MKTLSTVLFLVTLTTTICLLIISCFLQYIGVLNLADRYPCYSKIIQVNCCYANIGHWSVGLIYHKYLARIKHFDTLNDLKKKSLLKENVIKVISFIEVESVCKCVYSFQTSNYIFLNIFCKA